MEIFFFYSGGNGSRVKEKEKGEKKMFVIAPMDERPKERSGSGAAEHI